MGNLSAKVKIFYLIMVILFSFGVFIYLLDTWGVIRLEEKLPFLAQDPPVSPLSEDSPTQLEIERIEKMQAKLEEEELRIQELQAKLKEEQQKLQEQKEELEQTREGIELQQKQIEQAEAQKQERQAIVREMANRIYNMPPDDSVAILAGWSNTDVVDVFLQMEETAEEEGRQSIVPFLLTKMPKDRAAIITTLMMDDMARSMSDEQAGIEP